LHRASQIACRDWYRTTERVDVFINKRNMCCY